MFAGMAEFEQGKQLCKEDNELWLLPQIRIIITNPTIDKNLNFYKVNHTNNHTSYIYSAVHAVYM